MKRILRAFIINSAAIWILDKLLESFIIENLESMLAAAALLTLVNFSIRPIAKLITLPLNALTLGLFSWVINAAILYLVIWLIPGIALAPLQLPGMRLPQLGTLAAITVALSLICKTFNWVFSD